jgi:hypothetical protein
MLDTVRYRTAFQLENCELVNLLTDAHPGNVVIERRDRVSSRQFANWPFTNPPISPVTTY